jgi:1,4-dihydroxy-6-naphthoate synthase
MVNGKIDTEGLIFEPQLFDVETLNRMAFDGTLDMTKLSYHAFAHLTEQYALLHSGSALGNHCGPLLISKKNIAKADLAKCRIAIPGIYTTAFFLYGIAFGKLGIPVPMVFSDIEAAVLSGEVDAGVIIHENRFTYAQKGLLLIKDLGAHWEDQTGWPIPLGGIVVNRKLPLEVQNKLDRVMARSVAYAQAHQDDVMPYVRQYAQEMDETVMKAHIDLYVNHYTLRLGSKGEAAVRHLMNEAMARNIVPMIKKNIFIQTTH